jgi:hypothetical protein
MDCRGCAYHLTEEQHNFCTHPLWRREDYGGKVFHRGMMVDVPPGSKFIPGKLPDWCPLIIKAEDLTEDMPPDGPDFI